MKFYTLKRCIVLLALATSGVLFCSCNGNSNRPTRGGAEVSIENVQEPEISIETIKDYTTINIYIENSASVFGYVNGPTDFKEGLIGLYSNLKNNFNANNINLYFVNDKINKAKIGDDAITYLKKLSAKDMRVGNIAWSELDFVFKQALSNANEETITVLLTDGIYSIPGLQPGAPVTAPRALTKDVFWETALKHHSKLNTNVIKMSSYYNGTYYTAYNHSKLYKGERPYYIFLVGSQARIDYANDKIKWETMSGYKDKYVLTSGETPVFYSALKSGSNASIRAARGGSSNNAVHKFEVNRTPRDGSPFYFAVAVDFSQLPMGDDYILDANNYDINNEYTIKYIETFNTWKSNVANTTADEQILSRSKVTHIITVESNGGYANLKLDLAKKMPSWISKTSVEDDRDINTQQDKTFAFQYLIEGIELAYGELSNNNNYASINIDISK